MMKTKVTGLIILMVVATMAVNAQRGDRINRMSKHDGQRFRQMQARNFSKSAFFTEEQKEAIKAIRLESAEKVKPLTDELRELRAHHATLTTAKDADLSAINKSIEEMAEVKTKLAKIRAENHQKIRSLLTEEQLLKFDTMKSRRGKGNFGYGNKMKKPQRGQRWNG